MDFKGKNFADIDREARQKRKNVFPVLHVAPGRPAPAVKLSLRALSLGLLLPLAGCGRGAVTATAPAPVAQTPAAKAPARADEVPVYGYEVVNVLPHDPAAFTQGLLYRDGAFFESTGLNGQSSLRKVDLKTGKDVELTHEGSIDDQIAWLDNDTLAYGVGEEAMEVPADGSAPPKLLLRSAVNPSRVPDAASAAPTTAVPAS